ncbi:MAG: NADH:flavin oxidoreductase [Chloroflexota bacterium]|nr:NADH:flavin oxidoreductase [Chloroflexota bacterium]
MPVDLFAPFAIGRLELRNRFVRSATWDGTADESGAVTDASVALYRRLAEGGVGLIVTGYAFVSPLGQAAQGQYGAHSDDMIPGLRRLAAAAHEGGARIALQIVHAGINSHYLPGLGIPTLAVSSMPDTRTAHREMTDEDIEGIIADFAAAAVRGREAGFDAVQLHGAHGYLMSQFLSPPYNRRDDRWGGSPENRRRFHLEVTREARQAVGADYPLMIKLGVLDGAEGGLPLTEGVGTARALVQQGIDAIEVSAGFGGSIRPARAGDPEQPYFRDEAAAVKRAVSVPVIAVGGIRSLETAQSIVDSGEADMVSMCRPFIREPDLVARWQRGDGGPSRCQSCGRCFGVIVRDRTLDCAQERRLREKGADS